MVPITVVIISFPRFVHESYCAFESGVAVLVGALEAEQCAVVSFKNHKSLRKTSSKMQTLKGCRRMNRAIKHLSADSDKYDL